MSKPFFTVFFILFNLSQIFAQQQPDSSKTLEEVVVRAFGQERNISKLPAAVEFVSRQELARFSNTNILPALNSHPGIKMEERSPGSYRLNIRGSSLRSPFGVRNVKIYFNDIPYTDPGGNSYLNQLGFYNFNSIEVIKGPGSSLYGAGTGGVLLIRSTDKEWSPGLDFNYMAGNFSLHNANLQLKAGNDVFNHTVNFQHHQSDGYRDHSEMRRDALAWHMQKKWRLGKMSTHLLLGDLYYETPGALTLAEYKLDPRAARPAIGPFPGVETAKAAIFQKMAFGGVVLEHRLSPIWNNNTSVYGVFSELKNPTFRNYGYATEPHLGGRTVFGLNTHAGNTQLRWLNGGEFQKSFTDFRSYQNDNGEEGDVISKDKINNVQYFIFSQLDLEFRNDWVFTAGASLNHFRLRVRRIYPGEPKLFERKFSNEFAPRVAILKRINEKISVYGSISRGFSPPTIAEVLPSSNVINTELDPESGTNYEAGARGRLVNGRFSFDINAFHFNLKNTIVQRRDSTGGDYFVNAGSTDQNGIETSLSYQLIGQRAGFLSSARLGLSHTWHRFRFKDFKQVNSDYSGNELPSVAPHVVVLSADLASEQGAYLNFTYNYTDEIALNDANSEYAEAFHLLDLKVGYNFNLKNKVHGFGIYAGVNNVLDETYSLGNDINGFGGRYYNAAAGRNFFGGVRYSWK